MQILVAPSRREIDAAHSAGTSLAIGVPSIKNLRYINLKRKVLWFLLGTSATFLHLVWNSAFFSSIPIASYPWAFATSDYFVATDDWSQVHPFPHHWDPPPADALRSELQNASLVFSLQELGKRFKRLEKEKCMEAYIDPLQSTAALVLVASNMTSSENNGSSLITGFISGWEYKYAEWGKSNFWICAAYQQTRWCDLQWAETFVDQWVYGSPNIDLPYVGIDYCLVGESGDNTSRCGLHYNVTLIGIVSALTLLESLLIFSVWPLHRRQLIIRGLYKTRASYGAETMVTMGDAIGDFLREHSEIMPRRYYGIGDTDIRETLWCSKTNTSWFHAVSRSTWMVSITVFIVALAVPSTLLGTGLVTLIKKKGIDMSPAKIWEYGFQVKEPQLVTSNLFRSTTASNDLINKVIFANSIQLLLSFVYLFYNNILTNQLVGDEWVRFLRKDGKKPLRVSTPVGMQRSSYILSLPLSYSIPLMGVFMLFHWVVSQSVFLVQTMTFTDGPRAVRLPTYDQSVVGFSTLGIILSLFLGVVLVGSLLVNSWLRKYKDIPAEFATMGTSSAAIGVVCRPPIQDKDSRFFPLHMGVLEDHTFDTYGTRFYLTFSTSINLRPPQADEYCWIPVKRTRRLSKF
ncbi:hypothetical protein F5Y02DRAFT_130179 [Annulohypoxylon stygium]|nr:hypothetical protein F5Y02DRAFT_130179 [Annulohypoxylon stygium]